MTDESEIVAQVAERAAAIAQAAEQSSALATINPGEHKLDPWFVIDRLRRNRVGDADLFVTLFRGRYAYVPEWDKWLYWSGHHWDIDLLCRRALADVEQVCAAYQNAIAETAQDEKSPLYKTMRSRIDKLRTAAGRKEVLECATSIYNPTVVTANELDQQHDYLATPSGVVDLRTGECNPGKPEQYMLNAIPTEWTGLDTPCPNFKEYLLSCMNDDQEMADFIVRLLGYGLLGDKFLNIWAIMYGPLSRNGKDTLMNTVKGNRVPGCFDGVPRVAALVAGVDTQAKYFRYVIRAFGFGETEESWLISCGTVPTFEALSQTLWRNVYLDAEGNEYRVSACVIDAMGAPGRTKQVYAWCAQQGGRAMPFKGEQRMATPVSYSPIEFFPDAKGSKIKIPGGVLLRRVDTTFFKGDLAEKLSVKPGDPGAFWLHANTGQGIGEGGGLLADYAREMCAEVFNPEKLVWENPHQRPNHFWDCEVMALVCAWELGVRNWERPEPKHSEAEPAPMAIPAVPMSAQRPGPRNVADRLARLRR